MNSTDRKHILLSIQPYFANKIFDGTKRVELRRSFPRVYNDRFVILYVSTPVKAIVGGFRISHIVQESPAHLWEQVQNIAGISREQFDSYYSGINKGYGIFFSEVWKYSNPITLKNLKASLSNFTPPQNFRYLHTSQAINLNLFDFENSKRISHNSLDLTIQPPTTSSLL